MPNESSPTPSPLAALIGGGSKAQKKPKRATRKQKVDAMRQYTTGRSIVDFIASQSENPFLQSLYSYSKSVQQRRAMSDQKSGADGDKSGEDSIDGEGESPANKPKKRTGIRTIQTFRRQLKTVERVTSTTQQDIKEVIKAISEIKEGILGIKSFIGNLKSSLDRITSSITPSPENSIAASAARMYDTAGTDTKELFKPIDVKSSGGEDYMYYRGAPQGRQFYKKGKSGTAGAIASKELSEDLYTQLNEKLSMISAKMNGGVDDQGKVLAPKDYGELSEVDDKEEVEKLEKALEGALKKVLPSALSEAGLGDQMPTMGGGGGGFGGFGRGLGAIARGVGALGAKAYQGIKNIGSKVGNFMRGGVSPTATPTMPTGTAAPQTTVPAAKTAAAQTAGATATKGAATAGTAAADAAGKAGTTTATKAAGKGVLKSALKKIPIIGAVAGLGFAASRLMAGDKTGAALEAASGLAGTVPGLGTAASVGLDATLAARDAGMLGKTASALPLKNDIPATIVERSSAQLNAAKNSMPPIVVNAPSAPPAPPPPQQPSRVITGTPVVRNPDDAFIRATSRDFYHPSSLYK
jgi:hypothetical protein